MIKPIQQVALHDMIERHHEVVGMTTRGPVALVEQEQITAILLAPAQWQAIITSLEAARECLSSLEAVKARATDGRG